MRASILLSALFLAQAPALVVAQDGNVVYPIPLIEQRLSRDTFRILDFRGSRRPEDRTQRATLAFPDSAVMIVKWARAAPAGETFNNNPRHEIAAYEIQKLFLDEKDYVVPPTILRSFDIEWYQSVEPGIRPTFNNTKSVLVALQYWLSSVTPNGVFDLDRFEADSVYARHLADLNLLTHLIKHNDSNVGNVLVSDIPVNPRFFAVDNGLAFDDQESNRGALWREMRVPRVPARTVERLRQIKREDLDRALGVLVEYEIRDSALVRVEPGENISKRQGVRRRDNRVQFGLTSMEITGVEERLKMLLRRIDGGRLKTF